MPKHKKKFFSLDLMRLMKIYEYFISWKEGRHKREEKDRVGGVDEL